MFGWLFGKGKKRKQIPQSDTNQATRSRSNRSNFLVQQSTNAALSSVSFDTDDCSKYHDSSHNHSHSHSHSSSDSGSSYDSGSSFSDSGSSSSCD